MTIRRTSLCLSMLLLLVLCFALLPAQALAAGDFDTPRELEVLSMSSAPVFRSSGEITVYFTDSWNWGTPYAYYWWDEFGESDREWPGKAMTFDSQNDYGQSIYRATIPADVEGICFNDHNNNRTVDITDGIMDGTMWYPNGEQNNMGHYNVGYVEHFAQPASEPSTVEPTVEPSAETGGYYLVGSFTNWGISNAYKLTRRDASEVEEYILRNVRLTTSDSFKIVSSSDGSSSGMWYPEGMGNSFGENGEIDEDGTYNVYFRPNYAGGEDWFYNCIYVDGPLEEPTEQPTEQPTQQPSELPTEQPTNELTVYFVDALNWDMPYIYYWPNGGDWPGKAMTFDSQNDYGESVYRVTIPADVYGIIFNANVLQTVDITRDIVDGAMWYTTNQKDEVGHNYVGYVEHFAPPASEPASEPTEEPSDSPDTPYDFFLPRDILRIKDYAFDGANMKAVYIPNGCTEIGAYAFQNCKSLQKIRIPSSVTSIDTTAFSGCSNVTVYGMAPSAAKDIADYYFFSFVEDRTAASEQYE